MTEQFVTDHVQVWDVAQMQYLYASFSQPSESKKTGPLYLKAKRRLAMALRIPAQKMTMAASSSCRSCIEPRTELEGHEALQSEGSASNPLQDPNKQGKKKAKPTVQRNTNLGEKPIGQAEMKVMEKKKKKKTKVKTSKKESTEVGKLKATKEEKIKVNATKTSKEKKTEIKATETAKDGSTEVKKTKTVEKKKTKGETVKQEKTGAQQKEKARAQQVKIGAKKGKTEANVSKGKKAKSKSKVKKEAKMEKA